MTLKKSSNVQEMRGKFENWNNDGLRYKDNAIIPLGKPPPCVDPSSRNRSFSVYAKGDTFIPNDVINRNNSFHQQSDNSEKNHFSEKQKLVENIVANIKSSNKEIQNDGNYRTVLNTLFDKEIKSFNDVHKQRKIYDQIQLKENKFNDTCANNKNKMDANKNYNCAQFNNYNDIQGNNNFQNLSTINYQTKSIYDNLADKYINNLNVKEPSENQKLVVKHQLNSFGMTSEPAIQFDRECFREPVRPSRRKRTRKKCSAPSPPSANQVSFDIPTTASSHHNLSTIEKEPISKLELNRRNSSGDLYPFKQGKEIFPNYHRDPFNERTPYDSSPEDRYSLPRHVPTSQRKMSQRNEVTYTTPPKKPPRTFAHDIYRQGKQTNLAKSKIDLETLYAKPIKKTKKNVQKIQNVDKSVSFFEHPLKREQPFKPPIAPKPHNLNYKRYSVIDPIESPVKSGNDMPMAKRNSSFRFSFRKLNNSSPMASKRISRLKEAMRSFHFKKDADARSDRLSKSEEQLNKNKSLEHIYAVPQYVGPKQKEIPQELHYMCSPLFPMENPAPPTMVEEEVPEKVRKDWGGLRKEFRQSCRMVQKRLKGVVR